jgi:predicted GNAT superfamily acetyltransferase
MSIKIRFIDHPEELSAVEELQAIVWPGSDIEVIPAHLLLSAIDAGGILLGAFDGIRLVGFVFGFPGYSLSKESKEFWHCSHMAGVHPDYRDAGLGFQLKRAQWQMVRKLGVRRITWTYDPLQSRNAKLNIAKLGAVCNIYYPNYYGNLQDHLNKGVPTDRFKVDWWLNTTRVKKRMQKIPPKKLDLAHYLGAETMRINETEINDSGLVVPRSSGFPNTKPSLLILEIPSDFPMIKDKDPELALTWRYHTRSLFQDLFQAGYLVTDFIFLSGKFPRSYYVLSDGKRTL